MPPDQILERLDELGHKLDTLSKDLNDPPRDGRVGGLLFQVADLERRMKLQESRREAMKLVALNVLTALLGGSATAWAVLHIVK